jgi:hypothetical protein
MTCLNQRLSPEEPAETAAKAKLGKWMEKNNGSLNNLALAILLPIHKMQQESHIASILLKVFVFYEITFRKLKMGIESWKRKAC